MQNIYQSSQWKIFDYGLFSPDNKLLVVKKFSEEIEIYEASSGNIKYTLKHTTYMSHTPAFRPDGLHFVTFDYRKMKIYDTKDFSCIKEITTEESVDACAYTLNNNLLVCASWRYIYIRDANTWEIVNKIPNQQMTVELNVF